MQVLNSNWPVFDVEVSPDEGRTWFRAVGKEYNYFEKPQGGGFGNKVDLRVICSNGNVVELLDVPTGSNQRTWARGNC